jgi:PEP-CTERM motif
MKTPLRCFALALLLVPVSAATLLADDLNVHFSGPCDGVYAACMFTVGNEDHVGSPATGAADFNGPWGFNFQTGFPTQWQGNQMEYTAVFGPGGYFQMAGPDDLTFTGQITSGSSYDYSYLFTEGVKVFFDGYWSNNEYASGEVQLASTLEGSTVTLDVTTVPEPATVAMFASGVAGLWGICRRR